MNRRRTSRHSERGNALFIVVMVVTLLTAVGLLAMRSASLSNQAAGYNRQGVQTLYLSEFAARSAAAELVGKEQHYFNRIVRGSGAGGDDCRSNRNLSTLVAPERPPCAKLLSQDMWTRTNAAFPGNVGTTNNRTLLGELGSSDIEGAFLIEMTDVAQVGTPVVGEDAGPGRFKHMQVLLTATAQVRPKPPAGSSVTTCENALTVTSSLQTLRARVTFGPVL
jgi:Tfp pilus assembly protein PilX